MKENLTKFMNKITLEKKNLANYKNSEEGIAYTVPIGHLIPRLDYYKLTDEELNRMYFDQKVEKGIDFNKITVKRPYLKYNDTKKEEDKNVIIDKAFEVNQVWNVSNSLGIFNTFNNKETAIKYYEELRKKIVSAIE